MYPVQVIQLQLLLLLLLPLATCTFLPSLFAIFHPFRPSHWPGVIRDNDIKSPQAKNEAIQGPLAASPVHQPVRETGRPKRQKRQAQLQNIGPACLTSRLQDGSVFSLVVSVSLFLWIWRPKKHKPDAAFPAAPYIQTSHSKYRYCTCLLVHVDRLVFSCGAGISSLPSSPS